MLPAGLVAQPADRADHDRLVALHPGARTVVRLLVGACSCDLVRPRHADPREDERHHRERYRRAGTPRRAVLEAIERHRRAARIPTPTGGWPRALAAFVAEHARNAGDTLYLLWFVAGSPARPGVVPSADIPRRSLAAGAVLADPEHWLEEGTATLVQS
jgi:hypothetical protein